VQNDEREAFPRDGSLNQAHEMVYYCTVAYACMYDLTHFRTGLLFLSCDS
jgi:hypothetical protein